ncbi:hypothetical protein V7128_01930 [Neobacillus vireti]|uniref:hypothetical protein n=1 Tax=Neobacillus vireti TaxID=220686 RepID=UPI002FFD6977
MEIDELTKKRIKKYMDNTFQEMMKNPKVKVQDFAGGAYMGALKVLSLLDIEIDGINKNLP